MKKDDTKAIDKLKDTIDFLVYMTTELIKIQKRKNK